ncbi:hypothetical protein [Celerinatantimonas yamalensis]|uniref:Uncharacterized protein n=1 Tax=Celerinatantimonas yamalensis TaxID=559956 RepID=A0ABW9G8V5_9GAMM
MCESVSNLELMQVMLEHDGLLSKESSTLKLIENYYGSNHHFRLTNQDFVFARLAGRCSEPDKRPPDDNLLAICDAQIGDYL